jgi:ribosome-binding ATPase YchF (GTP1/OBG family)
VSIAIVGVPQSGKSTLLSLLLAGDGARRGREVWEAVASIPDPRLDWLVEQHRPRKITPATLDFVDVGADPRLPALDLAGLLALPALRSCEALALLLPRFSAGAPQGTGDLDDFEVATAVADCDLVDRRLERIAADRRKGLRGTDAEAPLLERLRSHLHEGRPLRSLRFTEEEERRLRGFQFLSLKPVVVVENVAEDAAGRAPNLQLLEACARAHHTLCTLSLPLETELAQLPPGDRGPFLAELGISEPALDRFLRAAYECLGLISFLTSGPDECRAWTIRRGAVAPAAAGRIHTDIERGFIRAEVVAFDDLQRHGDMKTARAAGAVRLEGREYTIRDGDVVEFRFSV